MKKQIENPRSHRTSQRLVHERQQKYLVVVVDVATTDRTEIILPSPAITL
jgi:hypothetical protein